MQTSIAEHVAGAQEAARTGDVRQDAILTLPPLTTSMDSALLNDMTTDQDGNTLLHISTLNGHTPCIHEIQGRFSKSHRRMTELLWAFAMRANKAERNTALHVAARHEDPDMLRAVYRIFCSGWLPGYESYGVKPAEDATDRLDEEEFGPPLMFLRKQNAAGRDAAAEARAAGREANAKWCEDVVSRLDPERKYRSPEAMAKLSQYVGELLGIKAE